MSTRAGAEGGCGFVRCAGRAAISAALLALLACVTGCGAALGDFCHSDRDCPGTLRCSALGGQRGVCVYPEALAPRDARSRGSDGGALARDAR